MATKSKTQKVLERTLDIVSTPGAWGKGVYVEKNGTYANTPKSKKKAMSGEYQFCLVGAFREACQELKIETFTKERLVAYGLLQDCLPKRRYPYLNEITAWNDARGRRQDQVVKVVQCAVDKAKEAE